MNIKNLSKTEKSNNVYNVHASKDNVISIIEYGENKIKQIQRRISENEMKLESMESHSDYDYKDLLKELNEADAEHKKDLRLFIDMLCKYRITIK